MTNLQSENAQRQADDLVEDVAPLDVERTGDDSPAGSLWGYIWRMSGKHQIAAGSERSDR